MRRFLDEVPALQNMKLVAGIELRGGRDVQLFRLELPGPKASKDIAPDARVRIEMPRALLNEMAEKGTVASWRRAVEKGQVRATGQEQILRLVAQVVERHEQRAQTRRARAH